MLGDTWEWQDVGDVGKVEERWLTSLEEEEMMEERRTKIRRALGWVIRYETSFALSFAQRKEEMAGECVTRSGFESGLS